MPLEPFWTISEKEYLRALWAEGKSQRQCAIALSERFGRSFTRGSIAGKVYRLELPERIKPPRPKKKRFRKPKSHEAWAALQARKAESLARRAANEAKRREKIVEAPPPLAPPEGSKTLFELTGKTCRWPYGDPGNGLVFCGQGGANLEGGKPYCDAHTFAASHKSEAA